MEPTFQFESQVGKFDFNHWSYHLPVPDEYALQLMDKENKRVMVWLANDGPYHMALMKSKEYWYILVNQELRKKHQLKEGSKIKVQLAKDPNFYGHELPEELEVLLDQDKEGHNYFKSLTPGKQRSLVYIVTKVKNPESRMKKSLAIVHHLKLAKGVLDFKQLNEWIKYYNNL